MSVLPLLCKVLERQAFNELCNYLREHDLDTENQSGFPKYRSCQSLLIKVTDFLLGSIDSGKIAAWFVYDISKESLWSCWSPNTPRKGRVIRPRYDSGSLVSIESYLSDRYFQVKIGKVLSSKTPLQYDLESPVLGPLIFIIYMKDLAASPEWNAHWFFCSQCYTVLFRYDISKRRGKPKDWHSLMNHKLKQYHQRNYWVFILTQRRADPRILITYAKRFPNGWVYFDAFDTTWHIMPA